MIEWIRSSACGAGECVEVAFDLGNDPEYAGIRTNTMPTEVIWVSRDEWEAFVAGVKAGEFG